MMGRRQLAREPLSGWIQIVKGPRPPAEKWPRSPQTVQGSAPQQRRRQTVNASQEGQRQIAPVVARVRRTPDQLRADASTRVSRLRAAIDLLGEGDAEEKRVLQLSLQKAEQQAEVLPLSRQIAATKEFIERAKKRIPLADKKIRVARVALQDALDEKEFDSRELPLAEARLEQLLAETVPVPPVEVTPQDLENQITSLQQMVNQLQAERDALAARVQKPVNWTGGISSPSPWLHRGGGFGVRPCIKTKSVRGGNPVHRTFGCVPNSSS